MRQQLTNKGIAGTKTYAGMFDFAALNLGLYLGTNVDYTAVEPKDHEPGSRRLLLQT